MNGAVHAALHRCMEGLALGLQQFRRQTVLPLADGQAGAVPFPDFGPPVGGQTVLPALVEDGADAAGKAAHRQGDGRRGEHQAGGTGVLPKALGPKVALRKRPPAVRLDIPRPP